jgi:two-component system cell cycle sensor histidine kinase/response regulator CckA
MKQATDRMAKLTAQLLASGFGGRYYHRPILISDSVRSILSAIRPNIPDSVRLIFESAPDLPSVTGDQKQIRMAVSAVIENAVEAVETDGFVRISCQKEASKESMESGGPHHAPKPFVCLSIEDNGKGMDSKTLERVYDPFFTTRYPGRGLGLSAAYGIAKNHGGFIDIESELEKGTKVSIYLPASEEEENRNKDEPC